MITGSITLEGVTNVGVIKILQHLDGVKTFSFVPRNLVLQSGGDGTNAKQSYGNVVLSWSSKQGMTDVIALLNALAAIPVV